MQFRPEFILRTAPQTRAWLAAALLLGCQQLAANGWEHTSVDFEVLVAALDHENPEMRARAAESIGFRRQPGAAGALLARLGKREASARVRQKIYASLGKLGDPAALEALGACLKNETDVATRAQCAGALGHIDAAESARLALAALDDASAAVRANAAASLGSFDDAAVSARLIELCRDDDARIRYNALLSLGRSGATAAAPVLLESLRQAERAQQLVTLKALTLLANPGTADALRDFYRSSDDVELRQHALVALANTRARGSERYFLDALDSEDQGSQLLGLAVLRNFGGAAQAPAVAEHGAALAERLFAAAAGKPPAAAETTRARLRLLDAYLRTVIKLDPAAGEALYLKSLEPPAPARDSSAGLALAQGFYRARWQALYGLGYCDPERARRPVVAALDDPDPRIRAVATRSLGVLGAADAGERLQRLLGDEAAEVRWMAARVIGRLNLGAQQDALLARLDDEYAQVRLEAALALGYLRARPARARLAELAKADPDRRVGETAAYALSLIE